MKFKYEVAQYLEWCEKQKPKFDEANETKRSRLLSEKHRKEHHLSQLWNGEK